MTTQNKEQQERRQSAPIRQEQNRSNKNPQREDKRNEVSDKNRKSR
jgi:hypothetical protein